MKRISARQAQKERERKEKEKKYTWVSDWDWEDIMSFVWLFGNNRLVKKGEEGEQTIGEAAGLTEELSVYCDTFKTAALKVGIVDGPKWDRSHARPKYIELFNEIDDGCKDLKKELKDAKTTEEISGLIGTSLKEANKAAEEGDSKTAARMFSKVSTLSTRLDTAKNYIRGAVTYLYFLRMRGYDVHDMGPDTLAEYLGTPEHGYRDGVLQKVQFQYRYAKNVRKAGGGYFSERQMQDMSKYTRDFVREILIPKGVFNATDEDGTLITVKPFKAGQELSAAEPIPYRISLDKYLKFPKEIYTKQGKLLPNVNEILLIYNAIHKIKYNKWSDRDPMNKFAKNRCLYEILIRLLRESGARPANIRWLKWGDFVIKDEENPYISWVDANLEKEAGKKPPDITYLSSILASMIETYRSTRKLDPGAYFIRTEFFPRKTLADQQPISKEDLGKAATKHLQDIVKTAYKDRPDVIAVLGGEVGAKRFRKSLATLLFGTIKDTKRIPALTGDTLDTLDKFYTEDKSAKNPRIRIDRGAKERYTEHDISRRIFDNELPPGITHTKLVNSCKLK